MSEHSQGSCSDVDKTSTVRFLSESKQPYVEVAHFLKFSRLQVANRLVPASASHIKVESTVNDMYASASTLSTSYNLSVSNLISGNFKKIDKKVLSD